MTFSSMKYFGVMLDSARLTERHSFYFDLVPYLAKWGYNTIWWHFTDDQGCSLEFEMRPELSGKGAFSKQEIKELISCAQDHGIEVIPELESFGHMGYITIHKEYSHLSDAVEGKHFGAICPSNPETLEILEDLIGEVSELFTSDYIHAGFDEVNFGSCPRCQERLKEEKSWEIFAQHVETVQGIMAGNGKKMMMWGDHLVSEAQLADRIPKDIVICDWQYFDVEVSNITGLLEKGFDVICCPALTNFFKVIHPRESNLQNIDDFSRAARSTQSASVVGMMNTVWCPYRFLQGAVIHGIALAASIFRGDSVEKDSFSRKWAADYFGVSDAQAVGCAIGTLYAVVPELLLDKSLAPLNRNEFETLGNMEIGECERMGREANKILITLQANRPHVSRNINHYDDLIVTTEIIAGLALNGEDIGQL
ncbi:MAG: family 20 glycosylhydrolase, partial [Deltaproteobacteria bacterium]|nr:family 20 glycosylhydrolase [Deltaproteobacteria bacterium]